MILGEFWDLVPSPKGLECGVIVRGNLRRFELWVEHADAECPAAEGTNPFELESLALARGATKVWHWYHAGRDHMPCECTLDEHLRGLERRVESYRREAAYR